MKRQCKPRAPGFLPPAVDKAEQLQQQNPFITVINVTAHVLFPFWAIIELEIQWYQQHCAMPGVMQQRVHADWEMECYLQDLNCLFILQFSSAFCGT